MTHGAWITLQEAVGLFDYVRKLPDFILGSATKFCVVARILPYVATGPAKPQLTIASNFPKKTSLSNIHNYHLGKQFPNFQV